MKTNKLKKLLNRITNFDSKVADSYKSIDKEIVVLVEKLKKNATAKKLKRLEGIFTPLTSEFEILKREVYTQDKKWTEFIKNKELELNKLITQSREIRQDKSIENQISQLKDEIVSLSKEREAQAVVLRSEIRNVEERIKGLISAFEREVESKIKETKDNAALKSEIEKEFEKIRIRLEEAIVGTFARPGGNMNRRIRVDGTNALSKYTDINFVAGSNITLSVADDNTDKDVDVTITAAGVVPGTFVRADGTVPLTADWDAGSFEIRSQTFESDVVTGTAPFIVASTTLVTNLNADLLDGKNTGTSGNVIPLLDGNNTYSGTSLFNEDISVNTNAGAGTAGVWKADTFTGRTGGSINLSVGTTTGNTQGGNGGSLNAVGGTGVNAAGGAGGTLTMNGGTADSTRAGGAAGSITTSGGNASSPSQGGIGGNIDTSANGIRPGGNITTTGGSASGASGGAINTSGGSAANSNGGAINTSGGAGAAGGAITTSNGGGAINTTGTGSIQFGVAATRTTLNGSATAARTLTMPDVTGTLLYGVNGGTYTPTLTNVANLDASTAYQCQYFQVGTVVTVSGKVDVDPTLAATSTQLGISLPVASNIGAAEDCAGTAFSPTIAGQGAAILGDAANNRAQMEWISGDITNQPMYFVFVYEVI